MFKSPLHHVLAAALMLASRGGIQPTFPAPTPMRAARPGHSRSRSPGKPGRAGAKLARMAREQRIGLSSIQ